MLAVAEDGQLYPSGAQCHVDQSAPLPGLANDSHRSSESPFAEPLCSSAGDATCSGDGSLGSDQTQPDGGARPAAAAGTAGGPPLRQLAPLVTTAMLSALSGGSGDDSGGGMASQRPSADGQQQPKSSQICFDYTKGLCTRGDKCKYSHDLATIVHFNSREKGICFDYLRNQCHRGLLCRFSHDLSNIAQQCQASEVFSNSAAAKGKTNAICYDFVKGVCQRGNDCRYSHDLSLIARTARGGQQAQRSSEICYDYLRGRCNRGASCKYSHNISFLASPGFLSGAMGGPSPGPHSHPGQSGGGAVLQQGGAPPGGAGAPNLPAGSASLGGALPSSASLGGGVVAGIQGMVGSSRLAPSISADPLMLGGPPAGSIHMPQTSRSPEVDGRMLETAMSAEFSDMGDGGWGSCGPTGLPHGAHMHALAAAAAHQRHHLAAAAAAAARYSNMHAVHMGDMAQHAATPNHLGTHGTGFASAAQQQVLASSLASQQSQPPPQGMLGSHMQDPGSQSQLHRAHSAPLGKLALGGPQGAGTVDSAISALLANLNMAGGNPALLAETLSNLAVAAQAQAVHAARMSAPGTSDMPLGMPQLSAPQPVPGPRSYEHNGYPDPGSGGGQAPGSAGGGSPSPPYHDGYSGHHGPMSQGGGQGIGPERMQHSGGGSSRHGPSSAGQLAAAGLGPNVAPDLLPLLKEIWNK